MQFIVLVLTFIYANCVYSQDVGGVNLSTDGADGSARNGTAPSEGDSDSSDSNSRNQSNRSRPIINYLPAGVQQFTKTYPKTHFRFVAGDILSASFFEVTGLFVDTAGDDPLNTAIERTSTVERHAGLLTFLGTATAGGHAINGVEKKINNRLGIDQTNKRITQLKNFAGVHILAGVYGYYVVDAAIKGKSKEEVLDMLKAKETFASALSMHLAFMGADKFVEYGKGVKKNLSLISEVRKSPQALKIANAHNYKSGLSLYKDALKKTSELNELRKDLTKSKAILGAAQPALIPALAVETAVEWTVYYTFAKIWNSLIHDEMISFLNNYDQQELNEDMSNAICYAANQGALHYDEKVLRAAQIINNNIQQLYGLMYAPLIDKQLKIAQKLMRLDYLESLGRNYFALQTISERDIFIAQLLNKDDELYELNLTFISSLIDTLKINQVEEISKKELKLYLASSLDAQSKPEKIPAYSLNASAALREHRRNNKVFFQKRLQKAISLINTNVLELQNKRDKDIFFDFLKEDIQNLEEDTLEIQNKAKEIAGMSFDDIENSYRRFKINPETGDSYGSFNDMNTPESIYDLILIQKKYTNILIDIAKNRETKDKILKIQNENEFSLYFQVKSWEIANQFSNK